MASVVQPTTTRPCPYVGPRPFELRDVEEGRELFGRDREVEQIIDLLVPERIVLLYSPSGAGKTSLIQAKLIPRLRTEDFDVLHVIRVGLEPQAQGPAVNRYLHSALRCLGADLAGSEGLDLRRYLDGQPGAAGSFQLLIFDQFEEILTADPTDLAAKTEFFTQLGAVLRDRNRWALFAMREEYLAGLDAYLPRVPTHLSARYRLDLLDQAAALQAVTRPAQRAGVTFAPGVAEQLVADLCRTRIQQPGGEPEERVGPSVEPVQLQVVCVRLWDSLSPGATTIESLRSIGEVNTALRDYYRDQVHDIATRRNSSERQVREWFERHLITSQGFRGQVLLEPTCSQGLSNAIIDDLVDAHLVRAEPRRGLTWFELAHDRLVEPVVQDNIHWFEQHLTLAQRRADLWSSAQQPESMLLSGRELAEAEAWAQAQPDQVSQIEGRFISLSRQAEERQRGAQLAQRARQRTRFVSAAVAVLALALLIMSVGLVSALNSNGQAKAALLESNAANQKAEAKGKEATSRQLAANALLQVNVDPELSTLLALQAVSASETDQAVFALRRALAQPLPGARLAGHTKAVRRVEFSPDGQRVVTVSDDGTAKIWDVQPGQPPSETANLPHDVPATSAAFSSDGAWVATGALDGSVRISDANGQHVRDPLGGQSAPISSVAFSPDGQWVVTASQDRTVRIWNAESGEPISEPLRQAEPVYSAAFSPAGTPLMITVQGMTAWIRTADGSLIRQLSGHTEAVNSAAISVDGHLAVTGSKDGTARIWNVDRAQMLYDLRGHTGPVYSVAFSRDGLRVVTTSEDGTANVWDVSSGALIARLRGPTAAVYSAAFSPDGRTVITGGENGNVLVWDLSSAGLTGSLEDHPGSFVAAMAISPDRARIAAASQDKTARLWDAETGAPIGESMRHATGVTAVAFSADGATLATGAQDGSVRLWNAGTAEPLTTTIARCPGSVVSLAFSPRGGVLAAACGSTVMLKDTSSGGESGQPLVQAASVRGVAFSPDGQRLATAGGDGSVQVWDVDPWQERVGIPAHTAAVTSVAFSPDGERVLTGSTDRKAAIWNATTGLQVALLADHAAPLKTVAFSQDGALALTASDDDTIRVWDAATGDVVTTYSTPGTAATSAVFGANGRIFAGTANGTIWMYACEVCRQQGVDQLKSLANASLDPNRKFTERERQRFDLP